MRVACLSLFVSAEVVVIGMGQLGELFAGAFIQSGRTVVPVIRGQALSTRLPLDVELILSAVGEESAQEVISNIPDTHLDRLVLLQNELRPLAWLSRYAPLTTSCLRERAPTICIVWFEKKAAKAPVQVLPSVLFGELAPIMAIALDQLHLTHRTVLTQAELHHELCLKNLYILGLNIGGLRGATVASELLKDGSGFAPLVDELIGLEQASLSVSGATTQLDGPRLKFELEQAILADPNHSCAGRSAPARLRRTLQLGRDLDHQLPICKKTAEGSRL